MQSKQNQIPVNIPPLTNDELEALMRTIRAELLLKVWCSACGARLYDEELANYSDVCPQCGTRQGE